MTGQSSFRNKIPGAILSVLTNQPVEWIYTGLAKIHMTGHGPIELRPNQAVDGDFNKN